jgi:riboflavin synthase
MFTGIVQGLGEVLAITPDGRRVRLVVALPERSRSEIEVGASVALGGVCLTFVEGSPVAAAFDVIDETLRLTTLGALEVGDRVNVERAARMSDEIGGHLLSGHVSGTARVVARDAGETHLSLTLQVDKGLASYILPKGFIGLDGCSLTVGGSVSPAGVFSVYLIPETLRVTTLGTLEVGDRLNVEVDAMTRAVVDTVERVMARRGE